MLRLNLGAGQTPLPGYRNLDMKTGQPAFPLDGYEDGCVDELRASHVLEHYSHRSVGTVLAEWVRVLRPGGELFVAVPDLEKIARGYLAGEPGPWQAYLMGGHVDEHDQHGCAFDTEALTDALKAVGLVDIRPWQSTAGDCASLPVSLNLCARKPAPVPGDPGRVMAVMSVPRLGFQDHAHCAFQALQPLGIGIRRHTGAFWEQCITRAIEEALDDGADTILTLDYDSIFSSHDVSTLLSLLNGRSDADAIAPLQAHRARPLPLMTILDDCGRPVPTVPTDWLQRPLLRVTTAHFGLTLLRARALAELPRPWFKGEADNDGRWTDGRTDPDIAFWRAWKRAGRTLFLAPGVPIGHAELMVRWPGRTLEAIYQHPSDYWREGKPKDAWG